VPRSTCVAPEPDRRAQETARVESTGGARSRSSGVRRPDNPSRPGHAVGHAVRVTVGAATGCS
jgi:hypothetical protein